MTGSRSLRAFAPCAMVLLLTAARPAPAQDVEVFFQPGVTSNHFTGQLGRYSSGSLGLAATQGIQLGAFAAYLSLGTDFYLTNQPPPPYTRGLRTFTIATGLRLVFPFDPVTPIIGIEYANLGVVSNALNRFTGSDLARSTPGSRSAPGCTWTCSSRPRRSAASCRSASPARSAEPRRRRAQAIAALGRPNASARASRMTSSGAATPVQRSNAAAPWCSSIVAPSSRRVVALPSSRNGVGALA